MFGKNRATKKDNYIYYQPFYHFQEKKKNCLVEAEPKEPPSGPVPKAETPVHIREFLRNLGR